MSSILESIQKAAFVRLQELDILSNIKLLCEHTNQCAESLCLDIDKHSGTSITVLPPMPTRVLPGSPGPIFETVSLRVQIIKSHFSSPEIPGLLQLAEAITQHLHFWSPGVDGWQSCFQLDEHQPWKILSEKPAHSRDIWELTFNITANV